MGTHLSTSFCLYACLSFIKTESSSVQILKTSNLWAKMDIPESEQLEILKTIPKTEASIDPVELSRNYSNILEASQRISESIEAISKNTVSEEIRQFCMENGIPVEFAKEKLLFKKSVMNRIERNMFTNPLKDAIPGGPDANTLDIQNVKSIGQFERTVEYSPISKYLSSENEDEEDSEEYLQARFLEKLRVLKNPLEIITEENFLTSTPIDLFISMVKSVHKIKWNTDDGQYLPFNFFTLPEVFQKHRLYNACLQIKLYESRSLVEIRDGDFSDFTVSKFSRVKINKGKRAKSAARRNKKYEPVKHCWRNLESQEMLEDFPAKWIPAKLKTVVRKHCAEHSAVEYGMLKDLTDTLGSDSGKDETEENEDQFGVYMLILENDDTEMKCQIFFNYFESNVENSIKYHEQNISNIAVQICDTENFVYRPDWKTIDILLLLNLLNKQEVVCFQIAGNLEEDK